MQVCHSDICLQSSIPQGTESGGLTQALKQLFVPSKFYFNQDYRVRLCLKLAHITLFTGKYFALICHSYTFTYKSLPIFLYIFHLLALKLFGSIFPSFLFCFINPIYLCLCGNSIYKKIIFQLLTLYLLNYNLYFISIYHMIKKVLFLNKKNGTKLA